MRGAEESPLLVMPSRARGRFKERGWTDATEHAGPGALCQHDPSNPALPRELRVVLEGGVLFGSARHAHVRVALRRPGSATVATPQQAGRR
jgi:hypothetical protein